MLLSSDILLFTVSNKPISILFVEDPNWKKPASAMFSRCRLFLLLVNYRTIGGNQVTRFIQWRCDILYQSKIKCCIFSRKRGLTTSICAKLNSMVNLYAVGKIVYFFTPPFFLKGIRFICFGWKREFFFLQLYYINLNIIFATPITNIVVLHRLQFSANVFNTFW